MERIAELLRNTSLVLGGDYLNRIHRVARTILLWRWFGSRIKYELAIVRNHHTPLAASVALASTKMGKPVISFRHRVISLPTTYFPSVATKLVSYGKQSIGILKEGNAVLASRVGREPICKEFVPAGSLVDGINIFADNRKERTVLVIDQELSWTGRFYGIGKEFSILRETVRTILKSVKEVCRIIVRVHPGSESYACWFSLVGEFPERVELSGGHNTLEFDLSRSSAAIGLFSGALIMALASGIPAVFVWRPGWYYTPDLACFAGDFFLDPDEVPGYIRKIFSNPMTYNEVRERALSVSKEYYHNGELCGFDEKCLDALLSF